MATLEQLHDDIQRCSRCPLRAGATQSVPGLGCRRAKYMVIGRGPGREEDETGVPFVGLAGNRLNKLFQVAGIDTNDCYITNLVKCRPPNNREPRKGEISACLPWLARELALVRPKTLIVLGAAPLARFSPYSIAQMHGTMFMFNVTEKRQIPVIAQYHPAACLHRPRLWSAMMDDWVHLPKIVDASYILVAPPRGFGKRAALDTESAPDGSLGQWSLAYRDKEQKLCVAPFYNVTTPPNLRNTRIVMHNAKWDIRVLRAAGLEHLVWDNEVVDTMIAAYCLGLGKQDIRTDATTDAGMIGGLGLKYLARRHLGMEMKTWTEVMDKPEEIPEYNAKDSVATLLLWERFEPKLPKHFWEIDMPLLPVLMKMEERGIAIDVSMRERYAAYLNREIAKIKIPFNAHSVIQVGKYIYETLGITPFKFTDTGLPSTDQEVLETIDDPVVKDLLHYRELTQERNTYVKNYIELLGKDGRIHPEFKQTSTATGRSSCANPNLQNVPRDGELRKMFVASPGHRLVVIDFSQLELRVYATLAQDAAMLKAFADGRDIHQETADALGIDREIAKTMNFMMQYIGDEKDAAWNLSSTLHIPMDEARRQVTRYFDKYSGLRRYIAEVKEQANTERKMSSWFGRTRRLDAMYAEDWRVRKQGEREALNMPTQSTAADIAKIAMIALDKQHLPMVLQVHDEIILDVPTKTAVGVAQHCKEFIPTLVNINGMTFPVEVGTGNNWYEAKKNTK